MDKFDEYRFLLDEAAQDGIALGLTLEEVILSFYAHAASIWLNKAGYTVVQQERKEKDARET